MSVPQFHPGKVLEVFPSSGKDVAGSDTSTQAMVKMWDGHTLTVNVAAKLKSKVKPRDLVLVDYYPSKSFQAPVPSITITKILRGSKARAVVEEYKNYQQRMKTKKGQPSPAMQMVSPADGGGRYIG